MHPLLWIIIIVLGLYACGGLEAPRREAYPLVPPSYTAGKVQERRPMTEAEKRFGCRVEDTTPSGECP